MRRALRVFQRKCTIMKNERKKVLTKEFFVVNIVKTERTLFFEE